MAAPRIVARQSAVHERALPTNGFLEMAAEEKMKQGMSRKDALRAVRLEQGNLQVTKEVVRAAGWESLVETLWQDLRFAARMLRKNPGATAAVVIALALGIGLNTAVFTFVNALLVRPPAGVKAPDRLLEVWIHNPRSSGAESYLPLTYPDYLYYRNHNQSFGGMLAFDGDPESVIWNKSGEGQVVMGQLVSGNFFSLLGVHAVLGRTISAEDDRTTNSPPVVVLGHAFWQQSFGSDPMIVGKALMLNGVNYNVIGVAPASFAGLPVGIEPDFWAPTTMVPDGNWLGRWARYFVRSSTTSFVFALRDRPHRSNNIHRRGIAHVRRCGAGVLYPRAPGDAG